MVKLTEDEMQVPDDAVGYKPDEIIYLIAPGCEIDMKCRTCGTAITFEDIECMIMVSPTFGGTYIKFDHECPKEKS